MDDSVRSCSGGATVTHTGEESCLGVYKLEDSYDGAQTNQMGCLAEMCACDTIIATAGKFYAHAVDECEDSFASSAS